MQEPVQDWDGHERRSIPFQLMNYMDERLARHTSEVQSVFRDHTADEMDRYNEILRSLGEHREETERRFTELFQSIDAYTTASEALHQDVMQAFPKDEDGAPDFKGHAKAHKAWIANAEKQDQIMAFVEGQMDTDKKRKDDLRFIVRAVIVAIAGAVVMWAGKVMLVDAVKIGSQAQVQQGAKQ